ncbi:MAG: hypothetical protein KJ077_10460 [Anaerolineae bacterium]|nr:hypothetical protein [Anaerolineae bacterium]
MPKTVILSDNLPCEVATLGLFDLEDVGPDDPGDFTYEVKALTGETYREIYPLAERLQNPPPLPGSDADEWEIVEYQRFQAAVAHQQRRFLVKEQYVRNAAKKIIQECLKPKDRKRVVTAADYTTIYEAGRPPRLGKEDIAAALRRYFPGSV